MESTFECITSVQKFSLTGTTLVTCKSTRAHTHTHTYFSALHNHSPVSVFLDPCCYLSQVLQPSHIPLPQFIAPLERSSFWIPQISYSFFIIVNRKSYSPLSSAVDSRPTDRLNSYSASSDPFGYWTWTSSELPLDNPSDSTHRAWISWYMCCA